MQRNQLDNHEWLVRHAQNLLFHLAEATEEYFAAAEPPATAFPAPPIQTNTYDIPLKVSMTVLSVGRLNDIMEFMAPNWHQAEGATSRVSDKWTRQPT